MQKILVTGANGFVGQAIVKDLLAKGYGVLATGRSGDRHFASHAHFEYRHLDFLQPDGIQTVFEAYRPQVVIHSGAMSKPDDCERDRRAAFLTNVTGTVNLLNEAGKHRTKFIFLSTDFVFDGEKGMYREDDPRRPVNFYGETKMLAEEEVMRYTAGWCIARTILVYGRSEAARPNILTSAAEALRQGETLRIFDDQQRTPTFVNDLAEGIEKLISKNAHGTFHLSGRDVLSPYQMCLQMAEYLNYDPSLIERISRDDLEQLALRPLLTGFNISKAQRQLDFNPISFAEGLAMTFDH